MAIPPPGAIVLVLGLKGRNMRRAAVMILGVCACAMGADLGEVRSVRAADITVRDVTRQTRGGQVNDTTRCERAGGQGAEVVRVRFDVLASGRTANPEVVDTTDPCYDRYARTTVLGWRYRPPVLDGEPVRVTGMSARLMFSRRGGA